MQASHKKNDKANTSMYIAWISLATFYLYQYIFRSAPGVLIHEIRSDFHINADEFALIGSMFYYGYSVMQIPLGIAVDRIGIRRTVLASILICILSTCIFASTDVPLLAYLSRFLFGLGAASAFTCSLKFAHDYLPASVQGVVIGATLTFGVSGALLTGVPLNYVLHKIPQWREVFFIVAALGVFIWLFVFIFMPKSRIQNSEPLIGSIWHNLLKILKTKQIIIYAFIAIGLFLPFTVVADLWGSAFLMKKFNLTREMASPILMNIYIGMAFGSIILPYIALKYDITNRIIQFSAVVLLLLFSSLVYLPFHSEFSLIILLIIIGFFCGAEMLCFTAALKYTNSHTSGLTIGVVNTMNMLSGAIMQQVVGTYLDFTWQGQVDNNGLRIYFIEEFVEAFSILVIIIALCAILACFALNNNKQIKT